MGILRWITVETVSAGMLANAVLSQQAQTALTPLASGQHIRVLNAAGLISISASDLTVQLQSEFTLGLNIFDANGGFLGFAAFESIPLMNPTGGNQRPAHTAEVVFSGPPIDLNFYNSQLPPGAALWAIAASVVVKNGATAGRILTIDLTVLVDY